MKIVNDIKDDKINTMISMVKFGIVLFVNVIIYQGIPNYILNLNDNYNYYNIYTLIIFVCVTALVYLIWLVINIKVTVRFGNFKTLPLIEILFLTIMVSLPMYLSNSYQGEFKFIFLLIIILTVIQYGLRYGIISSLFSAVVILSVDLIYAPIVDDINVYFEKDLIIILIFVFIAWILGYYVDLEMENKREKENQLQLLNDELEEQNNQRQNIESVLLKNELCYDMLFENSINAIIIHEEGKIIYANESSARLLGYENSTQLNEKLFYEHYSEDSIISTKGKYIDIINNKSSKVIDKETILNCEGNFIEVRNTSSFFTYNGRASVLTFLLDITHERELEILKQDAEKNLKLLNETREFNFLITEFFTNISHELKTPVNVIYVAIQAMGMYFDNHNIDHINKFQSYLKTMKQNCLRMIRLINNLLDITKVDHGFSKINKKNGNIISVVEDITQSVASYIKSKDIQLIFDTNVEEKIMAFDHDKIERIMLNLLSNAFKYSKSKGNINVNLEDRGDSVIITVKDEGEGIPENKLDVIFERFGQANRSLSRECEGTGIGLYLVKSFVEIQGGKISVISNEGKGSEFSIVLPVELVNDEDYEDKVFCETNVDRINIEFSDIYSISN